MRKVISVKPKEGYTLALVFDDGTAGSVSIEDRLFGPMFEPLRDLDMFAQVRIDTLGVVCWPNEADLDPDSLYQKVRKDLARQEQAKQA